MMPTIDRGASLAARMRIAAAIVATWSGIAQAQPAPRVVLDVALPVAEGFTVDP